MLEPDLFPEKSDGDYTQGLSLRKVEGDLVSGLRGHIALTLRTLLIFSERNFMLFSFPSLSMFLWSIWGLVSDNSLRAFPLSADGEACLLLWAIWRPCLSEVGPSSHLLPSDWTVIDGASSRKKSESHLSGLGRQEVQTTNERLGGLCWLMCWAMRICEASIEIRKHGKRLLVSDTHREASLEIPAQIS